MQDSVVSESKSWGNVASLHGLYAETKDYQTADWTGERVASVREPPDVRFSVSSTPRSGDPKSNLRVYQA